MVVVAKVPVSEARAALPELLDRVQAGEEVTITRHGRDMAVLVRPDALRARRADEALAAAERLSDVLARARGGPLSNAPGISEERAEELLAEVASGRSAR